MQEPTSFYTALNREEKYLSTLCMHDKIKVSIRGRELMDVLLSGKDRLFGGGLQQIDREINAASATIVICRMPGAVTVIWSMASLTKHDQDPLRSIDCLRRQKLHIRA